MNRIVRILLTTFLASLVCMIHLGRVRASVVLTDGGRPCAPAEDQILIHYDPMTRTETLIVSPALRYRGESFAWALPLAVEPKVSPAAPLLFQRLASYTSSPVRIETRFKWSFGFLLWEFFKPKSVQSPPLSTGPGKIIVARRTAAARGVIVAQPDEAKFTEAIRAALGLKPESPYQLPPEFLKSAAPRLAKKDWWVVAAAKTDAIEKDAGFDEQVALPPFALTFETDAPIAPITAPSFDAVPDAWPKRRNFKVYAVGRERLEIASADGAATFPATAVAFADRVSQADWRERILAPGGPEIPLAADWFLTAFVHTERGSAPPETLTMRRAENQATFRPSPEVIVKEERLIIPGEGLIAALAGGVLFWRQRRKSASP
jgi:hypothetical protein